MHETNLKIGTQKLYNDGWLQVTYLAFPDGKDRQISISAEWGTCEKDLNKGICFIFTYFEIRIKITGRVYYI